MGARAEYGRLATLNPRSQQEAVAHANWVMWKHNRNPKDYPAAQEALIKARMRGASPNLLLVSMMVSTAVAQVLGMAGVGPFHGNPAGVALSMAMAGLFPSVGAVMTGLDVGKKDFEHALASPPSNPNKL